MSLPETNTPATIESPLLIVDDHKTNRFVLKRILRDLHLNIIEADSGEAVLELLKEQKPFLILMDVNLPGINGLDTASQLRSNSENATIPIIFITAQYKEDLSIQTGYETGAVDYLVKPVDSKALISKVKVFSELQQKNEALKIQTQQIIDQQKALEESYRQLKDFSHIVAHDLKNPLSTMVASMELLLMDGVDGEEGKEILTMHQQTGYRLLKMIDELLETAQNINEMAMSPVVLSEVLNHVLSDLSLQIKHRNAVIDCEDLPTIVGSETHLYQVFQNIVSNALKYSKPDVASKIKITSSLVDGPAPKVKIEISDNGIGFDSSQKEKLFEPFQRLTEEGEGRGIGLATVRKIIEAHGGNIYADATLGEGSCFTLELPIEGNSA
jgi:signal transduction histidine kinase